MIDSTQYDTARNLTLRSMACAELYSAQFDLAGNLTPRSMILRGTLKKYEYLGENETKNENILTHWSVAQTGWNEEKKLGGENLVGLFL